MHTETKACEQAKAGGVQKNVLTKQLSSHDSVTRVKRIMWNCASLSAKRVNMVGRETSILIIFSDRE